MSAKEYKNLVSNNKTDVMKQFFVGTNKPIAVLPADGNRNLNYGLFSKKDHEVINTDTNKLHRKSMTDLKFSKFKDTLLVGNTSIPQKLPKIGSSTHIKGNLITQFSAKVGKLQ
jgi:hypothetical protein